MNKITCITIDDEPLALGLIVNYIEKTPFLHLCGQFSNPIDAMEYMENNQIQLIFLDIQMPDLIGTDFARTIDNNSRVIFTTAYDKYAVEGFKLDALDYLLKPISYEVFLKSAQRARKYFELLNSKSDHVSSSISLDEEYLFIKADQKIRRIHYSDILYFEGMKDYIKLYLKSTKAPLVFHATMKSLEVKLQSERFMRVHRSFIVNLNNIGTIEHSEVVYGKQRIPISENYRKELNEFIKKRSI